MTAPGRPQRLVFGAIAEAYDAHRPGYPDALLDELAHRAGDEPFAVDVGCGTGKVAVALAARGIPGIGVEPDPDMAAVAQSHLSGSAWTFDIADLERCRVADGVASLVTCAQAWHWVDPVAGVERIRAILRPGGWLAILWNRYTWPDVELRAALDRVYEEHAPDMASSVANMAHGSKGVPPVDADGFAEIEERVDDHVVAYTTESWLALLGTHSNHLQLPAEQTERLYEAEAAAIDAHGGSFEIRYRTETWLARRA